MVRVFFLLLLVSACAAAPQKSLPPVAGLGAFESAFVDAGSDRDARTVAHIVSVDGTFGLVAYVSRTDGRAAGITRAEIDNHAVPYERITMANGIEGGMILHSNQDMARAATRGVTARLCGQLGCHTLRVPATLYQQALLE